MTNNSEVLTYNIVDDNVSTKTERWFNKSIAFWLITLIVSAAIVAATELWLLPLVVRYEFDLSWIKVETLYIFANAVVEFTQEAAPYTVPIISAILWFRFNFSLRKLSHYGLLEYAMSIGSAVMGMIVAMVITMFAFIAFVLIVLAIGGFIAIKLLKLFLILT